MLVRLMYASRAGESVNADALTAILKRLPDAMVSVDTVKAGIARAALDAGAAIVNDVSGFRLDPALPTLCAERQAGVILMHSRGGAGGMTEAWLTTGQVASRMTHQNPQGVSHQTARRPAYFATARNNRSSP